MNEGFQFLDIIILAMIAGFIALRLRSILGRRHEDENQPSAGDFALPRQTSPQEDAARGEGAGLSALTQRLHRHPEIGRGLKAIARAEPWFDVDSFLEGARSVYPIILDAFWRGDREALKPYLSPEVLTQFSEAIAAREKAGHHVEAKVMEILDAEIIAAEVRGEDAEITVRYRAEIISVTRDAEDRVVEGTLSDTVNIVDVWTFERRLKSEDPNWILIATRSE